MGSGKTTLLKSLITELAQRLGVQRVLIITYRQSLSLNMLAELGELGFINYRFVRNTWRPEPRTFKLTNDEAMWTDNLQGLTCKVP